MEKTKRQLRAEAAERVRKAKDAGTSIGYAIVGREYYPWEAYETLIDLLTDEPMDTQRDTNGTCPDDNETCPNDRLAPENDVSADAVDANDGNENLGSSSGTSEDFEGKGSEVDSREKLEADMLGGSVTTSDNGVQFIHAPFESVLRWLNRQAAITEQECLVQSVQGADAILTAENAELKRKLEAATQANGDYRDEWHRVCEERMNLRRELTAEKNKSVELAEQLGAAMAERDEWRAKVGAMLDAAQEIRRIADIG